MTGQSRRRQAPPAGYQLFDYRGIVIVLTTRWTASFPTRRCPRRSTLVLCNRGADGDGVSSTQSIASPALQPQRPTVDYTLHLVASKAVGTKCRAPSRTRSANELFRRCLPYRGFFDPRRRHLSRANLSTADARAVGAGGEGGEDFRKVRARVAGRFSAMTKGAAGAVVPRRRCRFVSHRCREGRAPAVLTTA